MWPEPGRLVAKPERGMSSNTNWFTRKGGKEEVVYCLVIANGFGERRRIPVFVLNGKQSGSKALSPCQVPSAGCGRLYAPHGKTHPSPEGLPTRQDLSPPVVCDRDRLVRLNQNELSSLFSEPSTDSQVPPRSDSRSEVFPKSLKR